MHVVATRKLVRIVITTLIRMGRGAGRIPC